MTRPEVKRDFARVRSILHAEWDPIGCHVPPDEYDRYCWPVLAMLQRKAPRAEIESHLRRAAGDAMKSPVPEARLALVIDHLIALDIR